MALGRAKTDVDARRAGSVEAAIRRSLKAAISEDWPAAETWLERIVQADSRDLDAYFSLARLYRKQGAVGRAIRMHQNLLLRGELGRETRLEAHLELARDFDAGGFTERAAAGYETILDEVPRHPEALARRIALCLELKEYDRGLALIRRWRRIDREAAIRFEGELLLAQARARANEGDAEGARAALKRCLRRVKTSAPAWAALGDLEAEKGRDARAIDAWSRAVRLDAGLGEALLPRIAAGYAARGRGAAYEAFLRDEIERAPEVGVFPLMLSRSLRARGEAAKAADCLTRAIAGLPFDWSLRVELGRHLLEAEGENEAETSRAYGALLDALASIREKGVTTVGDDGAAHSGGETA